MKDGGQPKTSQKATLVQLLINFVIPIIILTRFSSGLGATKALLLALAFPIGLELYNASKRRKPSYMSLLAIGGILVTGAISLLGLSENWLAFRRSIPYLAIGIAVLISTAIKRSLVAVVLPYILDMKKIKLTIQKKKLQPELESRITLTGYLLSILLILLAAASFVLTKAVIHSATNSSGFNQEYAQLRLISLPAITLPLLVGITLILFYLVSSIEKLTGLDFDKIIKNKHKP